MQLTQGSAAQERIATPKTRAEFDALITQRNELLGQRNSLREMRHEVFSLRVNTSAGAAQRDLDARLKQIDARMAQVESNLLQLDEVIGRTSGTVWENEGVATQVANELAQTLADANAAAQRRRSAERGAAGAIFTVFVLYVGYRGFRRLFGRRAQPVDNSANIDRLQQSIDVMAVEIERISENQRFISKVLNEKLQLGAGEAQPVSARAKESAPVR